MARGGPRKAGGPSKKGSKATVTLLPDAEGRAIPPLPPAEDWLQVPEELGMEAEWNPAVERWWNDIWSSPMSTEFVHSDMHGLYLGCYYLHESLNAYYKPGERVQMAKAFENTLKSYGLTPSARESLRWQVAQGTSAQRRTDQLRANSPKTPHANSDTQQARVQDLYRRNG